MRRKTQKRNTLDALNKRFQKQNRKNKKWIISALFVVLLISPGLAFVFISQSGAEGIRNLPKRLPKAEVQSWKKREVDRDQLFVKLNTAMTMDSENGEANISIMNPPYSAYNFRIKIVLENQEETVLYSSDLIEPGTYLEVVKFQESLDNGSYEASVFYTFYGESQKVIIGEHTVPVTIEVNR